MPDQGRVAITLANPEYWNNKGVINQKVNEKEFKSAHAFD